MSGYGVICWEGEGLFMARYLVKLIDFTQKTETVKYYFYVIQNFNFIYICMYLETSSSNFFVWFEIDFECNICDGDDRDSFFL